MTLFGSATRRVRPLRLAFMVGPNNKAHVRQAIQIASTIWGGAHCPIIPLYRRMPRRWREGRTKAVKAEAVVGGYLDAFDPDILVQFPADLPKYVQDLGLEIVRPAEIWGNLEEDRLTPKYAIGIYEILGDVFERSFKYKSKYPPKVIVPKLPKENTLFWASVLGGIERKGLGGSSLQRLQPVLRCA